MSVVKIIVIIITLAALVDILTGKFKPKKKETWVIVVLLFNVIGVIAYLIFRKDDRLE